MLLLDQSRALFLELCCEQVVLLLLLKAKIALLMSNSEACEKNVPSSISGKPVSCSTRCTGNEAFCNTAALPPVETSS